MLRQPGRVQTPKHRNEVYCRQISRAAASNQSTRRYQRVSYNGQQNTVPAVQTVGARQVLQIEAKGMTLTYLRFIVHLLTSILSTAFRSTDRGRTPADVLVIVVLLDHHVQVLLGALTDSIMLP